MMPDNVEYVSIHAPPKGRDNALAVPSCCSIVSIHAPPKGRDRPQYPPTSAPEGAVSFNPSISRFQSTRPRRGATDMPQPAGHNGCLTLFQSTRPRRGATSVTPLQYRGCRPHCFNPRAPEGARLAPKPSVQFYPCMEFQSTRPRRGATPHRPSDDTYVVLFQSTRPRRGATEFGSLPHFGWYAEHVSIHAPPKGRDGPTDLYPGIRLTLSELFQSTRPRRGATGIWSSDADLCNMDSGRFQSTRPRRGATTG